MLFILSIQLYPPFETAWIDKRGIHYMKQLTFDFGFESISQERVHLEKKVKEALVFSMAEAIINTLKNEKGKEDDKLSEK